MRAFFAGRKFGSGAFVTNGFAWSLVLGCSILLCPGVPCSTALGQIDAGTASRLGLEIAWQSQVQMPQVGNGVVSTHLWADSQNVLQYAVVKLDDRTIRVAADAPGDEGQPIGLEEAKARARQQAAKVLGSPDGFEVIEVTIPRIKLVVVTSDGMVQTLDAESGRVLWAQACGLSRAPAHPGAVSPLGVTVIHGSDLYLLDWETGKALMTKPLRFSTSNAIAICNDIAFVSDFLGRVQAYSLGERAPLLWSYVMEGRAVGKTATRSDQAFSAIASDRGYVYVFAGGETPSVYIRYETNSPLTGSLTAGNGAFYVGNAEGVVSKVALDDRLGSIKWELHLGTTITAPPLVVGDRVYVATESGKLAAIEDDTGLAAWTSPLASVKQPLSSAGGILYCKSLTGQLIAIDAETGVTQGQTLPLSLAHPIANQLDDRLYLITKYGQVQCLRPVGATLPTMVTPVEPPSEEDSPAGTAQPAAPSQPAGETSPFNFGGGGDPFGTAPAQSQPNADPFGGAAPFGGAGGNTDPFGGGDPFGGSEPASGSDPFGGSGGTADPFGGSSGQGTSGQGSSDQGGSGGNSDPFGSGDPFGGSGN